MSNFLVFWNYPYELVGRGILLTANISVLFSQKPKTKFILLLLLTSKILLRWLFPRYLKRTERYCYIHEGVNADGLYLATVPRTKCLGYERVDDKSTVKSVAVIYSHVLVYRRSMKIIIVLVKPLKCCSIEKWGYKWERTISTPNFRNRYNFPRSWWISICDTDSVNIKRSVSSCLVQFQKSIVIFWVYNGFDLKPWPGLFQICVFGSRQRPWLCTHHYHYLYKSFYY